MQRKNRIHSVGSLLPLAAFGITARFGDSVHKLQILHERTARLISKTWRGQKTRS
jgi:hypothetical protein